MEDFKNLKYALYELKGISIAYLPKLAGALFLLIIGLWVISKVNRFTKKQFEKRDLDPSLSPFLRSLVNIGLKILLFITAISMMGVQMSSFVAILGAAGLTIGLSLQGTLANFAGGIVLLILRPFRVGDVVNIKEHSGTVKEIQIFYTVINTFDNKVVYIPNGSVANADMTNITLETTRRNEWKFSIAYGDDVDKAKQFLLKLIKEDQRILKEPEPFVAVHSLGDNAVNLVVRSWSSTQDLWDVYFEMNEKVYKNFPKEGLHIPFPQMDVHLHQPQK